MTAVDCYCNVMAIESVRFCLFWPPFNIFDWDFDVVELPTALCSVHAAVSNSFMRQRVAGPVHS